MDGFEEYLQSLSDKSKKHYTRWKNEIEAEIENVVQENRNYPHIVMEFFKKLHDDDNFKANTLWSIYSVVKLYLKMVYAFDVEIQCPQLVKTIHNWSKEEEIKQSPTFSKEDFDEIMKIKENALVGKYGLLTLKIIMILGTCGLMRCSEMLNLEFSDIVEEQKYTRIFIKRVKNRGQSKGDSFLIEDSALRAILHEFIAIFERGNTNKGRFLKKINLKGNGTRSHIGRNKVSEIVKQIARLLQKADWRNYTTHALRRSGATILSEDGVDPLMLAKAGGWTSVTTAQGYIAESNNTKLQIAKRFAQTEITLSQSSPKAAKISSSSSPHNKNYSISNPNRSTPMEVNFNVHIDNIAGDHNIIHINLPDGKME